MDTQHESSRSVGPVTILGAGTMGSAMARRLLSCDIGVHVWNRNPEPLAALAESGAETFSDPREAVRNAAVVLTLLPTADVVSDVMMGAGVLEAMQPGAVWAQMGTIGVDGTHRLNEELCSRYPDILFVDAPVSGSRVPAESGNLVVLASGPDGAKAIVDPVFAALGRRTLWLGPAGFGSRMKLVLNTWLAFEVEVAAEAMALARYWDVSDEALTSAISGSPLVSSFAASKLEKMQSGDDSADFSLTLALKDLTLVEEAAGSTHSPVAAAIAERWRRLDADGAGALDVSAARLGLGTDGAAAHHSPV